MFRRLVALFALCLPLLVGAQEKSQTTQMKSPNGVARTFLSFGQPYGGWLLLAFDSIPASQYGFRPTPVQQSIGYIAQHLENANYRLCAEFGERKYVMSARDSLADTIKAQWPKDTLIARVRASLIFCRDAVEGLSDAQLADEFTVNTPAGPQTVLRVRYLILLVTDLAEHYSQLASYMRVLGLVPPSAQPRPRT
ncbi:MAG: DinB family protein [bacterium]